MAKPRIFISHSTSGDPADEDERLAKEVCEGLATRLTDCGTFAVLLDRTGIKPGDAWYPRLNVWLSGCDGAVVLLSKRALASSYVPYEVSVLANRFHRGGRAFTLLPVYLPPIDETAVDAAFKGARLSQAQALPIARGTSVPDVISEIEQQLRDRGVAHGPTPLDRQIALVADILASLGPNLVDDLLDRLDVDLGDWDFAQDGQRRRLAAKLMGAGLDNLGALKAIFDWLKESDKLEIVNRLGSSWVPHRAAIELDGAAKTGTSVAATLSKPLAANMYLWQADPVLRTTAGFDVARVPAITGVISHEEVVKSLIAQIKRQLLEVGAFKMATTEEEALRILALRVKTKMPPVFVMLPKDGLDAATLAELKARKEFEGLAFFVLCGSQQPGSAFLQDANLTFLEPALESGDEDRYCQSYNEGCAVLQLSGHGSTDTGRDRT